MVNAVTTWPASAVVFLCVFLALCPALLFWWLSRLPALQSRCATLTGVEPAMIGAVGLLFGLFAAFLANDIWSRNQVAAHAVFQESDAIRTLARYAEGMSPKAQQAMQAALSDYAVTVIEQDWPKMLEGTRSKELLPRVRTISSLIISGDLGKEAGPGMQGRMIDAFTQLRDARQARLQIAECRKLTIKWYALIIFGLLTQVAIGLVHITRPRPNLAAQLVFAAAFASCLSILMLNEFPFSAMNPVSAEPLEKAVESLTRK